METEENGSERDESGKFGKGNKASAGRGPNKVSTKVKESIVNFLENNIDAVQESFDQLGPTGKLKFIAEILPYATPKLSAIQGEINTEVKGAIIIEWKEPGIQPGQGEGPTRELPGV